MTLITATTPSLATVEATVILASSLVTRDQEFARIFDMLHAAFQHHVGIFQCQKLCIAHTLFFFLS